MKSGFTLEKYLVLYIPWGISVVFSNEPAISYVIAWLGSFVIFALTLTGWVKPLPKDLSLAEQLMRPIFLVQIIFAGFMCCTSFFFFLNTMGYEDFKKISSYYLVDQHRLELTAQCQRYYCLGHAAFVTGILAFMNYPIKQKYLVEKEKISNLLFSAALITLPVSILFLKIPGLSQFYYQFSS